MRHRDSNLDLLRAIAIAMVIICHSAIVWDLKITALRRLTDLGIYGVDLFFVLSGWLIGGLYFREQREFGGVQALRFWLRRALRTMPPYFVALPIAWSFVHFHRGDPFNARYLVFLQNYLERIPFFLASWSLCVEEHFYLFIIPVLGAAAWLKFPVPVLLAATAISSPLLRFFDVDAIAGQPFGYASTATHFRLTGIALGVLAAWLDSNAQSLWHAIQKAASWLALPSLAVFLALVYATETFRHYFGSEIVAITAFVLLARLAGRAPLSLSGHTLVRSTALMSYSLYLTHGIVLQVCYFVARRLNLPSAVMAPASLLLIFITGAVYFRLVERTAISLRDRWVPRRAA